MVHAKAAKRCLDCKRRLTGHGNSKRCRRCAARHRYVVEHGKPPDRIVAKCEVCRKQFSDYASNRRRSKVLFCSAPCRAAWVGVKNSISRGGDGRRRTKKERDVLDYRLHAAARRAAAGRRYREKRPEILAAIKARNRDLKREVVSAYGGKCVCCGEAHIEFLTIDHTDGGGAAHRARQGKGRGIYRDLQRRGFPKDGYQCLCLNCNISLGFYGYCPHRPEVTRVMNKAPKRPGRKRTVA